MDGSEKAGIIVNTIYGKVIVAAPAFTNSKYTTDEIKDAWYRYVSATGATITGETKADAAGSDGKFKTTANIAVGLEQTLNGFSVYKATSGIVKGEPMPTPGIPESLNVLLHELRGLGLSIKLE